MTQARVVIVEDDENLRLGLEDNLEHEGYLVRGVATVTEARAAVAEVAPDLIILDIMLPDGDGYGLCRSLRDDGYAGMVLMLTARTLEDDLVRGFDAGADDYLAKPYRLAELLARAKALLRRAGAARPEGDPETTRLGDLSVDHGARRVTDAAGEEVVLTRTEFDLLAFFLRSTGKALTRDEILDEVWGRDIVVDTRTVDNFVSSLKKKLGWTPGSSFHIRTVRGVGYRFELE